MQILILFFIVGSSALSKSSHLSALAKSGNLIRTSISHRSALAKSGNLSRRSLMAIPLFITLAPSPTKALDMDAFARDTIASDTKNCNPKLDPKCQEVMNDDEALCKYGGSGKSRGEACKRVRASNSAVSTPKENAFGEVDRGKFDRCNPSYTMIDSKWVKEFKCVPGT
ncbi:hypothetical protein ScalyP_jg215 [Parmales sp. scaly parma]|nr:hypothetical protein ScalyP_jg215 [Parmales sp. scaly parma]